MFIYRQNALGRLLQDIVAQSGDISCLDWVGKSLEFNIDVFCAPSLKNFRFGSRSDWKRTGPDRKEPFAEVRFSVLIQYPLNRTEPDHGSTNSDKLSSACQGLEGLAESTT